MQEYQNTPSMAIPKRKPLSNKNVDTSLLSPQMNFEELSPNSSPKIDSPHNSIFGKSPSPRSFRNSMSFGSPRKNASVDAIDLSLIFGKDAPKKCENKENFM